MYTCLPVSVKMKNSTVFILCYIHTYILSYYIFRKQFAIIVIIKEVWLITLAYYLRVQKPVWINIHTNVCICIFSVELSMLYKIIQRTLFQGNPLVTRGDKSHKYLSFICPKRHFICLTTIISPDSLSSQEYYMNNEIV